MTDEYRRSIRDALRAFQVTLKELSSELRATDLARGQEAVRSEYLEQRVKEAIESISDLKDRMIVRETTSRNYDDLKREVKDLGGRLSALENSAKGSDKTWATVFSGIGLLIALGALLVSIVN